MNSTPRVPTPVNEPIRGYLSGSPERSELRGALRNAKLKSVNIPLIIGGEHIHKEEKADCLMPHDLNSKLGVYSVGDKRDVRAAIKAALTAKKDWASMPPEARAAIFLKAAELLSNPRWRAILNAATMLTMSKTVIQAEIDSACELIDFIRFNVHYAEQICAMQPNSADGIWNQLEHRPLEGFVFAITPFNFTAIAGNLSTAPAIMGNTVVWKPASSAVYPAYLVMKLLEEAGLPPGVINMVPGPGSEIGPEVLKHKDLAGVHFTGSTETFRYIQKTIGKNIAKYKSYPRVVGETGGKDFVFAHHSANADELVTALIRGSFEFQGQKCSAASRAYIPESFFPYVRSKLVSEVACIKMGDVNDFTNFIGAVIDRSAFDKIAKYIEYARASDEAEIICGGGCDDSVGYFVEPTVVVTTNPHFKLMEEEIFGPVLTIYVYPDSEYEKTLQICDETSIYALTGAIFAKDRAAINVAIEALRNSAGNFYINDKPTGAVVGQQPFGGSRASGTNDKAGSILNLLRWASPRTIKETFDPPRDFMYPYMTEDE